MQNQSPVNPASDWQPSPRLLAANRRLYALRRAYRLQKKGRAGVETFAREQVAHEKAFTRKHPAGPVEQGGTQ